MRLTICITLIFVLVSSASAYDGVWSGNIFCPQTSQKLNLQVILNTAQTGIKGVFNSTDQGFSTSIYDMKLSNNNKDIAINVDMPNNLTAQLEGHISNESITGSFNQGMLKCNLQLQKTSPVTMKIIPIQPSYQTEPMWCWLTVGEMVFRYTGVLNDGAPGFSSQCQILQSIMLGSNNFACSANCTLCASLGGGSSREVAGMLSDFPRRLRVGGQNVPRIFSSVAERLPANVMRTEIDAQRPVIIGISPGQQFAPQRMFNQFFPPMHVALVIGYMVTSNGLWYLVNDPYPFPPAQNPYKGAGAIPLVYTIGANPVAASYWIKESGLNTLAWSESILVRKEP